MGGKTNNNETPVGLIVVRTPETSGTPNAELFRDPPTMCRAARAESASALSVNTRRKSCLSVSTLLIVCRISLTPRRHASARKICLADLLPCCSLSTRFYACRSASCGAPMVDGLGTDEFTKSLKWCTDVSSFHRFCLVRSLSPCLARPSRRCIRATRRSHLLASRYGFPDCPSARPRRKATQKQKKG